MSSARSLFESFIIMIVFIMIAVILLFAVGIPTDNIFASFLGTGFIEDVSPEWDTYQDRDIIIAGIYCLIYGLPIAGVLNFIATAVRRQQYDSEYPPGYVPRY